MRTATWLAALAACTTAHGATLGDVYVEKEACTAEHTFGNWQVRKRTTVHAEPNKDSKQTGILESDTTVLTRACEFHVVPGEAQIVSTPYKASRALDTNKTVYILDTLEGGYTRVFQNGVFHITKIATKKADCERRDDPYRCWVKVIREPQVSLWIEIGIGGSHERGWVLFRDGNIERVHRNSH